MQDFLVLVLSKLFENFMPLIVSAVTGYITVKLNGFLNLKKEEFKNNIAVSSAIKNLNVNQEQSKFVEQKIIDALYLVEEKAYQSWKNDSLSELTSKEKNNIAVNFVTDQLVKVIQDSKVIENIPNLIEQTLPKVRTELDNYYNSLKIKFVQNNGKVPENSRPPVSNDPNVNP